MQLIFFQGNAIWGVIFSCSRRAAFRLENMTHTTTCTKTFYSEAQNVMKCRNDYFQSSNFLQLSASSEKSACTVPVGGLLLCQTLAEIGTVY